MWKTAPRSSGMRRSGVIVIPSMWLTSLQPSFGGQSGLDTTAADRARPVTTRSDRDRIQPGTTRVAIVIDVVISTEDHQGPKTTDQRKRPQASVWRAPVH